MVEGSLYRIDKNVYSEKSYVPELAIMAFKYPQAVVTMKTAFHLYNLTDVIMDVYDFATERDAAKISDRRIEQYFIPHELFPLGIQKFEYKGYNLSIYSKERMLVELIRYSSKLPYDYYKEIILNYRKIIPSLNIQEIQEYAVVAPKSNMILKILQKEVL
ncbi:MAG: hypothetical protein WCY53_05370 [Sphaerochaetaceae bacterium]